jgi:HD-GYP domain-containing protein (c-di-GMP phosphodiesterase class II)
MSDQQVPFWANAAAASLLQILRSKEPGTFEHSLRVGEFSKQLAVKMGMSDYQQRVAEIAGLLHDIGEATIDQDILAKPTKLNPIEYEIMKSHVIASEDFIRPLANISPFFKDVQEAIRSHHEHFNGMGYPDKLKGDQIPMVARIITLLDSFDSMTTSRVYKEATPIDKVYLEIEKLAGIQFDRQIVTIFMITHRSFKKSTVSDLENQLYKQAV